MSQAKVPKRRLYGLTNLVGLALSLLLVCPSNGQVAGAVLSGTVSDASGAVIPGAQVAVKDEATGAVRTVTTDAAGLYSAPNLTPATYDVTVTASGFVTGEKTGITLTVGLQQVLNVKMSVGGVTQAIQVTTEAPEFQLVTSSIGAVINSTAVRELPLNGRSWTDLATLQVGVSSIETQAPPSRIDRGNRGFGAQITVAGSRPQQNNYRLDGISIVDYSNGAPGSVLGGNLGVDAIQEFSVMTSNFSAEYGRTAGGVLNAVSRSGTNAFHGGVYEFLRNSALDARNFFDGSTIPPFRQNQFGADAGGPIRKNKIFLFGDYESVRRSKGVTVLDTVPSIAARGGTLCSAPDSTPVCSPHTVTVDPSVQKYLPFWPLPNRGIRAGTNGDIGIFGFAGQQVTNENFGTIRSDIALSSKDNLVMTYMGDFTPFSVPDALDTIQVQSETDRNTATVEETHVFGSSLVNSARIGFNRNAVVNAVGQTAIDPLANDPSLAAVPGQFAAAVVVGGLTSFGGGPKGSGYNVYYWNSFQGYDDAFWNHGTHSMKFGAAVERMQLNFANEINPSGQFTFGSLSSFLANQASRMQVLLPGSVAIRGLRQTLIGLYAQDDWHVRTNLTLNLGLRWEMLTVPTEADNRISILNNLTDATPHLGSPLFSNPTRRNFEPRVGFSWDPFHNGKTAVRGGFGVFDSLPLPSQYITLAQGTPFFQIGQVRNLPVGSFYADALSLVKPASSRVGFHELDPHRNYVMQWNLSVEHDLSPNTSATLGFVGSRGVHNPFRVDDADIVMPTLTSAGYLFPNPVGTGATINPNFGTIRALFNDANSFYDAFEAGVQKRMSHGLQIQGSFTWSKSIDNNSATDHGDQFTNSISSLSYYDPNLSRALSDFNVGRTLVVNATWQVPSPKSALAAVGWITNGWQLGFVFKVSDGQPFTATYGSNGDPQGILSSDPFAFPSLVGGPGCSSLVNPGNPNNYIKTQCFSLPSAPSMAYWTANCDTTSGIYGPNLTPEPFPVCMNLRGNAGRNIMIGPGLTNLDFSVFKNNYIKRISENFNAQFRAEFFNILNHANFSPPNWGDGNTDIFDQAGNPNGTAGLVTSTTTDSREIQFALKLIW